MTTLAQVKLWGRTIGAVSLEEGNDDAAFEYTTAFAKSGIEVSPLTMPLSHRVYVFSALPRNTFHGLPGLLADSLPDRFGHELIDVWLAGQGRTSASFNAVERLCYTGARGMGALEFVPATGPRPQHSRPLEIDGLVEMASAILSRRGDPGAPSKDLLRAGTSPAGSRTNDLPAVDQTQRIDPRVHLNDLLRTGTSAGGARAKAVIAVDRDTNEVRSGEVAAGASFDDWLLKFDGVAGNKDRDLMDPKGYGAIEYAYSLMAKAAGVAMSECRLLEENGRRHFISRRFDRLDGGGKLHMQSLGGLAHFDFNSPGAHAYEQVLLIMRRLRLPMAAVEEQFRRMVFNVIARNQDDHVKNIAFLMDKAGTWSLAPAFDMTYSYNPAGERTARHQMTINGKRDGFTLADFRACAKNVLMKRGRAEALVDEVLAAVSRWQDYAQIAKVADIWRERIQGNLRLTLPPA